MPTHTEIASQLVEVFRRILPPPAQRRAVPTKGKPPNVLEAMNCFYVEARATRDRHKLGVYGRARVAFEIQKQLLAGGYPAELCRQVLFSLIISAFITR